MKKILTIASIIALYSSVSFAKDQADMAKTDKASHAKTGKHHDKMFNKMDKDSNGVISKIEWTSFHDEKFNEADANKDGNLAKEELHKMHKKMMEKWHQMKEKMHGENSSAEHAEKKVEHEKNN